MKFTAIVVLFASIVAASPVERANALSARDDTVCPDPFDVCQYAETDGTCTIGYEGCIKKMGCNLCIGDETNCIGCASGCTVCS